MRVIPPPSTFCVLLVQQVEAKKERSLSKRVQSLSRFLLEALNKEGSAGGRCCCGRLRVCWCQFIFNWHELGPVPAGLGTCVQC